MSAADVLLLPSLAEGSPNVVKEALSCNLPVVATDVGDVAEVLEGVDRSHALPVDATVEDFASALIDVLRAAPARSNGRACTERLDARLVARRLHDIYLAVARVEPGDLRESTVGDLASL
jgi:glycosyltransferase involved in cell wall biosynthesis